MTEEKIAKRCAQAIREDVFPGCIVGIVRADGMRETVPYGNLTYEQDAEPVTADTVYDVASITKSIPTASLVLTLIAEGKLQLGDAVKKYLPELQNDFNATIEDLLRYRVHGPQMSALKDKTLDEIIAYIFEKGFDGPAGDSHYTNLPAFLLGLVIERVMGKTLDVLAERMLFNPLHMRSTTFFPRGALGVAPTEIDPRGEVRGLPHDESAYVFAKAGRTVGHAGLFSPASDLLNFFDWLLRSNDGPTRSIIGGAEAGLGWSVNEPYFMGKHAGPHTFGKTGFTGCSVVCDIEQGTAFIILSNRTYPHRPENSNAINAVRTDIADVILKSSGR